MPMTKRVFHTLTIFAFIFFVAFAPFFVIARTITWEDADSVMTEDLNAVDGINDEVIFAVGQNGAVTYSSDYGQNWFNVTESSIDYHGVSVTNGGTFVCGEDSTIIWTEDYGDSWLDYSPGTATTYYDIDFDESTGTFGWVVGTGGIIEYSDSDGEFWDEQESGVSTTLHSIDIVQSLTGWAVGASGVILYTDVGGEEWEIQTSGTSEYLYTVHVIEDNTDIAWAGGDNATLLRTEDGGTNWEDIGVTDLIDPADIISDISFADEDNGILTTFFLEVLITEDGGETWEDAGVDALETYYGVYYPSTEAAFLVGSAGSIKLMSDSNENPEAPANLALSSGREATSDLTPELGWDAAVDSDDDVSYYEIKIDDDDYTNIGNVTSYTVESDLSEESHTAYLRAVDSEGNVSEVSSLVFVIDTEAPVVSEISPTSVESGANEYKTYVSDNNEVETCTMYVYDPTYETTSDMEMTDNGTYFSKDMITMWGDTLYLYATCEDRAGNSTTGETIELTISYEGEGPGDITSPTVGSLGDISVTEGTEVSMEVSYYDEGYVAQCRFYEDGEFVAPTTISAGWGAADGTATYSKTYSQAGTYTAEIRCTDIAGNTGSSGEFTITVTSTSSEETPTPVTVTDEPTIAPETGATIVSNIDDLDTSILIKTSCGDSEVDINAPCRAVYYYSEDGVRHAFPNEKVYFTWFDDFDDIAFVTTQVMSEISLGSNITYRPGQKMVKFQTVDTVYAVSLGGVLHAIATEEIAAELYGEDWNTKIDDISDAFYSNYTLGSDINDADDYDIDVHKSSAESVDDSL